MNPMKYSSDKLVSAIITGICLITSACKEQDIQTKVIKSEIIDNHASILPKEVKTPNYSFNTSSTNVESWKELLKSEIKREKSFMESSTSVSREWSDNDE